MKMVTTIVHGPPLYVFILHNTKEYAAFVSDEGTCLEMADKDIIRTGRFGRTGRNSQRAEGANVAVYSGLETRESDATRRFRD
jgi:hypothetical protein